jgi:hypothetical protein
MINIRNYYLAILGFVTAIGFVLKSEVGIVTLGFFLFYLSAEVVFKVFRHETKHRYYNLGLLLLLGAGISLIALVFCAANLWAVFIAACVFYGIALGLHDSWR